MNSLMKYLLTGSIKFNKLPDSLVTDVQAFGRKQNTKVFDTDTQETYNRHDLEYFASIIEAEIESIVESIQGKIFVM